MSLHSLLTVLLLMPARPSDKRHSRFRGIACTGSSTRRVETPPIPAKSEGFGPANMAVVKHMALNLLTQARPTTSLKNRRKRAGWNTDYLAHVIQQTTQTFTRLPWVQVAGKRAEAAHRLRIALRANCRHVQGGAHIDRGGMGVDGKHLPLPAGPLGFRRQGLLDWVQEEDQRPIHCAAGSNARARLSSDRPARTSSTL